MKNNEILVPEAQNRSFFRGTGFHNIPGELARKPIEYSSEKAIHFVFLASKLMFFVVSRSYSPTFLRTVQNVMKML